MTELIHTYNCEWILATPCPSVCPLRKAGNQAANTPASTRKEQKGQSSHIINMKTRISWFIWLLWLKWYFWNIFLSHPPTVPCQAPLQSDKCAPLVYLKWASEIVSTLSKRSHHVLLSQCVRSQGMTGIFRQGEPRFPLSLLWQFFPHAAWRGWGEGSAQQKEIHSCRGDLRSFDYEQFKGLLTPSIFTGHSTKIKVTEVSC